MNMKKFSKRIGSLALALMLAFSYVPAVFAEEIADTESVNVDTVNPEPEVSDSEAPGEQAPETEAAETQTPELEVPDTDSPKAVSVDEENIEPLEEKDYTGWDTIKVFETTDIHGYITDVSTYKEETFQYRLAYIANIVNQARSNEDYEGVLLLDSGDIYQSTPHSNLTYGAALRAAMDKMGYDAVGLGNHEFDWDVTKYAADADGTMAPYTIGSYTGDPEIPVLMSNLYYAGTDNRVNFTKDYTVVEKGGYKIAILGWAEDYSSEIKASQIAPYTIDGDMEHLKAKAAAVKEESKADVLIILAHSNPVPIADAMDPDVVDLVAGGHTHRQVNGTSEVTQIDYIQGYNKAYGYSTAEIKIDPDTKEVDVVDPSYVDIVPKGENADLSHLYYSEDNDQLDSEIVKISQAAWDAVKDEMYEVLCSVKQNINRSYIDEANATTSVAGNWLSELMLAATKDQNTIAAFTNRGGIRTDLNLDAGAEKRDITVADIYTITPFGNRILTYEITGQQMARHLEKALTGLNPAIGNNDGYLDSNYGDQFAGIKITYKPVDGGIEVTSIVTDDGEVIDINDTTKKYRICVNEYCATLAGSVYVEDGLEPLVAMDDAPVDNLSTIAALRERRETEGLEMELDTSVHAMTVENKIAELQNNVQKYDEATVTSADKDILTKWSAEIEAMLGSGKLTDEEVSALNAVKTDVDKLLAKIAAAEEPEKEPGKEPVKTENPTNNKTDNKTDTNSNSNGKGNDSVKTGDSSEVMPWMVMLFVSSASILGVAEAARRKQKRG